MKTLCMDTSHRNLVIVLIEGSEIKASYNCYAWKKQSESIFVELIALMDSIQWNPDDIDEVVVTRGPGSYTGVRIAMSIAKVFCCMKKKKLYTISTLQLFAGMNTCQVILDARSHRVYYGRYQDGVMQEESIKDISELKIDNTYVGDLSLIKEEDSEINFCEHFVTLRPFYEEVENVHQLVPTYLKDETAYLVKP